MLLFCTEMEKVRKSGRAKKKRRVTEEELYMCEICMEVWEDETVDEELWIQCEPCKGWFHAKCGGYGNTPTEEVTQLTYICNTCS